MIHPLTWQAPRRPHKAKKATDPEQSIAGLRARIALLEFDKRRLQAENEELRLRLADVVESDSESELIDDIIEHGMVILEARPNGKHFISGKK